MPLALLARSTCVISTTSRCSLAAHPPRRPPNDDSLSTRSAALSDLPLPGSPITFSLGDWRKREMALGSIGAWVRGIPRQLGEIPWRSISGEAIDRCFLIIKFACFLHVTNNYVFGVALVHGPSMLPTLNMSGDVLLLDKMSHHLGRIGIGDVVLVRSPENPRKTVMKRVIGMEGDTITHVADPGHGERRKTVVVPKDHVWLQGDNIYMSRDSRQFGAVPFGLVMGKAFYRVWPPEGFGLLKQE